METFAEKFGITMSLMNFQTAWLSYIIITIVPVHVLMCSVLNLLRWVCEHTGVIVTHIYYIEAEHHFSVHGRSSARRQVILSTSVDLFSIQNKTFSSKDMTETVVVVQASVFWWDMYLVEIGSLIFGCGGVLLVMYVICVCEWGGGGVGVGGSCDGRVVLSFMGVGVMVVRDADWKHMTNTTSFNGADDLSCKSKCRYGNKNINTILYLVSVSPKARVLYSHFWAFKRM